MKNAYGVPYAFINHLEIIFGDNKLTWFIPTPPKYKSNFLEMLYKEEDIQKMIEEETCFIETGFEDEKDPFYATFKKY